MIVESAILLSGLSGASCKRMFTVVVFCFVDFHFMLKGLIRTAIGMERAKTTLNTNIFFNTTE